MTSRDLKDFAADFLSSDDPDTQKLGEYVTRYIKARELWPVTIMTARYSGTYEGGLWLAFNCLPNEVPRRAYGDDIECMTYWDNEAFVGRGITPDAAVADLKIRLGHENNRD